jgi:hypothetical protein
MADTVTNRTLYDGGEHAAIVLTNSSDGTGEAAVLKVDVSALNGAPAAVNIRRIQYNTFGMAVSLLWDADTDVTAIILQGDGSFDFTRYGGLSNNSGAGKTGDVKLTTIGHTAGDTYTVVLELEKVYG